MKNHITSIKKHGKRLGFIFLILVEFKAIDICLTLVSDKNTTSNIVGLVGLVLIVYLFFYSIVKPVFNKFKTIKKDEKDPI